jgi:hypothetical protein
VRVLSVLIKFFLVADGEDSASVVGESSSPSLRDLGTRHPPLCA